MDHSLSADILSILSNLPKHLRKSILLKKIDEFASMSDEQKMETVDSVLIGYRKLKKKKLTPLLTTCFEIISTLDSRMIVHMFSIYFETYLLNPELILLLDLQPIVEALEALSAGQKRLIFDCYFEALLLHHKREILKSTIPNFAIQTLDSNPRN